MKPIRWSFLVLLTGTVLGCHGLEGSVPRVLSVSPNVVCANLSQVQVQVKGENFAPMTLAQGENGPALRFPTLALVSAEGNSTIPVSDVTWTDDQTMSFTLPAALSGAFAIRATNPTGEATLSAPLFYVQSAPSLGVSTASVCNTGTPSQVRVFTTGLVVGLQQPLSATWADGSAVNLTASDCTPLAGALAGLQECTSVVVNIPATSSSANIVFKDAASCTLTANLMPQLNSEPVLQTLSPNNVCLSNTTTVQLGGQYFVQSANQSPNVVFLSGTTQVASVPATQLTGCVAGADNTQQCTGLAAALPTAVTQGGATSLMVQLQNPSGCMSQTLPLQLSVTPVVSAPAQGANIQMCQGGGGSFQITGTGLQTTTQVMLGTVPAQSVQAIGCTGIQCSSLRVAFGAAAAQAGNVTLSVSNGGGQCGATVNANVVLASGETLVGVTPTKVAQASDAQLTLTFGNMTAADTLNSVALVGADGTANVVCGTASTPSCPAVITTVSQDGNNVTTYGATLTVPAAVLQSFVNQMGPPPTVGIEVQFQASGCGAFLANAVTIQK